MQEPQGQKETTHTDTVNYLYMAAEAHSACFTPFLRRKFGPRAFMYSGPLALLLMFFYSGLGKCPQILPFIPAWLLMVIWRRITAGNGHSRSEGELLLAYIMPFGSVMLAKFAEALLCLGVGMLLRDYSEPLGVFVMVGCGSLMIVYIIEREAHKSRVRAMRDAIIENQNMSQWYQ